jgi:hypothetical protein
LTEILTFDIFLMRDELIFSMEIPQQKAESACRHQGNMSGVSSVYLKRVAGGAIRYKESPAAEDVESPTTTRGMHDPELTK